MIRKAILLAALLIAVTIVATKTYGQEPSGDAATSKVDLLSRADTFKIITDAKAKVFPAVVFIKPIVEKMEGGEKKAVQVSGSGVLISADGEVVTNFHVIDKAVRIRCTLFDGRHMDATLVGSDKETDLALLKLQRKEGETFPFATIGDSDALTEGDFVMAMGAPWGLNRSVSIGIVSCAKRYVAGSSEYNLFIQTDASLNPGNSGGPLVNTKGEVVGINSMGSMSGGGDLGFSIPSATVKDIVGQLRSGGKVARSWTGIWLQPIQDFDQDMYFDADKGVIISGCDPDSPGLKAGLKNGDRILSIDGTDVTAMTDVDLPSVRTCLSGLAADKTATVVVDRGGKSETVTLTPRIKGKVEGEELDCPRWNMTLKTINQFADPDLYFVRHEGVFIFGTKYPGNAAASGLDKNDIITSIDGTEIKTLDETKAAYEAAVNATPKKTRIVVGIIRGGLDREVVLDFAREYKAD